MESRLRIGEVARRAGVSIDTIRYYERQRLLPRPRRTQGGFRVFSGDAVERLNFIKQAQTIGLSLDEIRELLTVEGEASGCARMRDLLKAKLADLDERLGALRDFRRTLARHLAACETELDRHGAGARCPVIVRISSGKLQGDRRR